MGISLAEAKGLVQAKLLAVESLLPQDDDTGEIFQATVAKSFGDDDFSEMCEGLAVAMHELVAEAQGGMEKITGPTVRRACMDIANLAWETNITRPWEGWPRVKPDGRLCWD